GLSMFIFSFRASISARDIAPTLLGIGPDLGTGPEALSCAYWALKASSESRTRVLLAGGGAGGRALRRAAAPPLRAPAVTAPTPASMAMSWRVPASAPPLRMSLWVTPPAALAPALARRKLLRLVWGATARMVPETAPPEAAAAMRPQSQPLKPPWAEYWRAASKPPPKNAPAPAPTAMCQKLPSSSTAMTGLRLA